MHAYQPPMCSGFIGLTFPQTSVHFGRALRAQQNCTEVEGEDQASKIQANAGMGAPLYHKNVLNAISYLPPIECILMEGGWVR